MFRSLPTAGPRARCGWLLAALAVAFGGASGAHAQTPGCQVTYTAPTWVGGNGFGASIDIRNTGPTITGWSLVFNFPNGQRIQNGWPVSFTQPANSSTVTVASNAAWNATLATNTPFNVAFNGTFSGANNPPAQFTLNGTVCSSGGNTPPTVQVTGPTQGQVIGGNVTVPFNATASDAGGAVSRVEFRLDGTLLTSDTSAPYGTTFSTSTLTAGTHTAQATAFDNGTPSLSASHSVTFTVQGGTTNTPPTVNLTAPTSGQVFPPGTTSVNLAATATDPGGAVQRVEFRVGTTLVGTDTSSPFTATATGLTAGSYTATATAFDNGVPTPVLSAAMTVPFTIQGSTPSITATPTSLSLTGGTTGTSTFRLSAAPSGSVTVPIARTGSTVITHSPTSVTLNGTNWNTGVAVTFTAAAGTTLATSTFTASATGYNPATVTVTRPANGTAVFRVNPQGRITKNGTVFPVRCGSWFGLEGRHEPSDDPVNPSGAAMEQYIGNTSWANGGAGTGRTIAQTMQEISGMGINVIRLPLVPQTLNANDPQGTGNVLKNHSSVRIANSRLALETMIRAADAANIEVMLDIHSCSNYVGWRKGRLDARPPWTDADRDNYDFKRENYSCASTLNPPTVTTTHPYNQTMWLDNLRTVAGLGTALGVDNIIGIDIYNEPHDYTWAEWKSMTEAAYAAINAVNPNTLLFVQGVGTKAGTQDGSPSTVTEVPHGSAATNPNWGENLFEAGTNPINIPKERLVYSPHTYGPSVFVQKMFMDPAQTQCAELEGDAAGDANCNIVINPTLLRQGWEEHFGYLRQQNFAIVVGEFGGNMDWPLGQASIRDRDRWSHITPGVDTQWQNAFVDWMVEKGIEGCYWSINPESGDTAGWYGHAYDPISNESGWGQWLNFDQRKTNLLNRLWGR
jgi:endoglucanase